MNHHFHCNLNRFYPTQIDFREAFRWSDAKVLSFSFWISEKTAAQLGQIRCERRDIFIHCPLLWLFWSETNADVADDWLYASGLPLIFTYKVILDHNVTVNEQNREEDKYKINRVHWFSSDMRMYCFCGVWDKQRKRAIPVNIWNPIYGDLMIHVLLFLSSFLFVILTRLLLFRRWHWIANELQILFFNKYEKNNRLRKTIHNIKKTTLLPKLAALLFENAHYAISKANLTLQLFISQFSPKSILLLFWQETPSSISQKIHFLILTFIILLKLIHFSDSGKELLFL